MTNAQRLQQANTARQWNERKKLNGWKPKGETVAETAAAEKGIEIDPEFEALIPPLLEDDLEALTSSLLSEGCRDPLVVWKQDNSITLVDGHNRYRLCQEHKIPFQTVERLFDTREDVMLWMLRNQRARRNLNEYMRNLVALKEKDLLSAIYRRNQGKRTDLISSDDFSPHGEKSHDAWQEAAKANDTSRNTMSRVAYVEKNAPESIREKARAGELPPRRAEEITKELAGAADDILDIVEHFDIEDVGTITLLKHLHKEERESFQHIKNTGHIQVTGEEDAVPVTAPSALLYEAVRKRSDMHRSIAGQAKGTPAALLSSDSNEWYTPPVYLEAVRAVLGTIDIDPASNAEANTIVQARTFYDMSANGLKRDWTGRVFLNPPYGKEDGESVSNQALWSARLISQYEAGITTEAILLVNAITDAGWFQPLWDYPICFTDHRIPFYRPGGETGKQPVRGSVFVYFGANVAEFASVFRRFGAVVLSAVRGKAS